MSVTPEEAMFLEAMSAIQSGDRTRARDLLTRLLKICQTNVDYWVWMSAVVETPKEQVFCLKEALRLDPQNVSAKRGLILAGAIPVDESLVLPAAMQKRDWRSKQVGPENLEPAQRKKISRSQAALIGVSAFLVVGLIAFAVFGIQRISKPKRSMPIIIFPTDTLVLAAAGTPSPTLSQATTDGLLSLSMQLKATYTPTPLYINTPHAVIEAYRIGMRAFQRGDWATAEMSFQQVAVMDDSPVDVQYYLGETYRMQGDYKKAIKAYNLAIQTDANFAPPFFGRAQAVLADNPKNLDAVLKDLQTAVDLDPQYGEAYLSLASAQIENNDNKEARQTLDRAAALLPDSPLVYLYRAQAALELGDSAQALKDASRANQLDITLLDAYRIMGEVLYRQGDLRGALQPLQTFAKYRVDDADVWFWLAQAYQERGSSGEAIKALEKTLLLDNRRAEAYLLRAQLLNDQGSADKALDDFRAAFRLDKNSYEASLGIGKALMGLKFPGDAYVQFEGTRPLAKQDLQKAEVLFWRAQSLDQLDQLNASLRDWQALLALPVASVKEEWVTIAKERVSQLSKLTPSPKPKAPTLTVTSTHTRMPTATPKRTLTPRPTATSYGTPSVTATK